MAGSDFHFIKIFLTIIEGDLQHGRNAGRGGSRKQAGAGVRVGDCGGRGHGVGRADGKK